jgi:hypothetical protein
LFVEDEMDDLLVLLGKWYLIAMFRWDLKMRVLDLAYGSDIEWESLGSRN